MKIFLMLFVFFLSTNISVATMTKELNVRVRMLIPWEQHGGVGFYAKIVGLDNISLKWDDSSKTFSPVKKKFRIISNGPIDMKYRVIVNSIFLSCSQDTSAIIFNAISPSQFPNVLYKTDKNGIKEINVVGTSFYGVMDYISWTPEFGDNSSISEGEFEFKFPNLSGVYKSGGGRCYGGISIGV
ncbi:hypothetical protein GCR67_23125, partial [Salmonella enterica]|nr:hypothetical protein [Salmonella enterica]